MKGYRYLVPLGLVIFMVVSDKKKVGNNSAKSANKDNSKKRR